MTPPATRALLAAAERTARLLSSAPDMDRPLNSSAWTVGDSAAHLAIALRAYAASAAGSEVHIEGGIPEKGAFTDRLAAVNAATVGAEPKRDAAAAGQAILAEARAFAAATTGLEPDRTIPTPWYGAAESLTVAEAAAILLGEQLIHGYDIAAAAGQPWVITDDEARVVFLAVRAMMPRVVNVDAGRRPATYCLHLGRADRFVVRLDHGRATVEPYGAQRIDCHIAGRPVALLLLGYGRINQWQAIARAKLVPWGPKPWLALRFVGSFSNP